MLENLADTICGGSGISSHGHGVSVGWSVGSGVGSVVGIGVRQTPLAASQTSDEQSTLLEQPWPTSHAEQLPPQSMSDSSPFWRPSVQLRSIGIGVGMGIGVVVRAGSGTPDGGAVGTGVGEGVGDANGALDGVDVWRDEGSGVGAGDEIDGGRVGRGVGAAEGVCVSTTQPVTESDASVERPADAAAEAIDDASAPDEAAALTALLSSLTYAPLSSDSTVCALAAIIIPSETPALSRRCDQRAASSPERAIFASSSSSAGVRRREASVHSPTSTVRSLPLPPSSVSNSERRGARDAVDTTAARLPRRRRNCAEASSYASSPSSDDVARTPTSPATTQADSAVPRSEHETPARPSVACARSSTRVVGSGVGSEVGSAVGSDDGSGVGSEVGIAVGNAVSELEGCGVGRKVSE